MFDFISGLFGAKKVYCKHCNQSIRTLKTCDDIWTHVGSELRSCGAATIMQCLNSTTMAEPNESND